MVCYVTSAYMRKIAMFFPFYSTMMLGIESANVIALRTFKFTCGGSDSLNEMNLMMGEKLDAVFELGACLMSGVSANSIIDWYRQQVDANAKRLAL